MDFKTAFHKAYLQQQGIKRATRQNIEDYSLDPNRLVLLEETDRYWVIKVSDDGGAGEYVDIVWKETFEMDTLEVR